MKKSITAFLFCTLLVACSTKDSKKVTISGHLGGVADGTPIELYEIDADDPFRIDTIYNERFEFVFEDTIVDTLREMHLFLDDGKSVVNGANVWVEPSAQINIKVDSKYPHVWDVESEVSEQKEENLYKQKTTNCRQKISNVLEKINVALDNQDEEELVRLRPSLHLLHDSINAIELKIFEDNSTYSPVWFSKLLGFSEFIYSKNDNNEKFEGAEKIINIYNNLTEEQKSNELLKDVPFLLFPPIKAKIGDKIIETELQDIEGNQHKIADYSGKYRLLDFWATWCGPCLAATPEVKEIADKYKNKLTVITINIEGKEAWSQYSKDNEMLSINLHDTNSDKAFTHYYNVEGYPHYVLIAPNDTIMDMWSGYDKGSLHKKIKEHIEK